MRGFLDVPCGHLTSKKLSARRLVYYIKII